MVGCHPYTAEVLMVYSWVSGSGERDGVLNMRPFSKGRDGIQCNLGLGEASIGFH